MANVIFCFGHIWPYICQFFHWCERGQGRGAGGSAGGASLTPMKKLGAMTGNSIAQNGIYWHSMTQNGIYWPKSAKNGHIFLKWLPGGQKFPLMFSTQRYQI